MTMRCKESTSVAGTCKTVGSVAGVCKDATPIYGEDPELRVVELPDYDATSASYEGAISPATYTYTVKNVGNAPMNWTAVADDSWVGLSVGSGTLLPGEEVEVVVTLDNTGLLGTNTSGITFTNTTDGVGDTTRGVELVVTGEVALTLEGRTQAGTAELIGFSEYTSPSTPAKKYRVQNQDGVLYRGAFSIDDCTTPSYSGSSYSFSASPSATNFWQPVSSIGASAVPVSSDATTVTYKCTGLSFSPPYADQSSGAWGRMTALRLVLGSTVNPAISVTFTYVNQQGVLYRSLSPYKIFIQGFWTLAGWIGYTPSDQNVDISSLTANLIRDEYNDYTQTYSADGTGPVSTGTTARYIAYGDFPLTSGGTASGSVSLADFSGLVNEVITQTEKTSTGSETCVGASAPWLKAQGEVVQTLTVEDTEEDALARMLTGSWSAWGAISTQGDEKASYATRTTGFTFVSTASQWRVSKTGLLASHNYGGITKVYRRAVGTSDPWVEVSTLSFSGTTDGSGNFSYTGSNLPVVSGYEYCTFNAVLNS